MRVAYQITENSSRNHPVKNGIVGRMWMEKTLRCHPRLTLYIPQPLLYAHAISATDKEITSFF